ncbi:hypothetical protein T296_05130 [Pantoea agglomerans Eh318]|nr:hypothetical protein T296_05130 [Pantoea agglomerans Eh318]
MEDIKSFNKEQYDLLLRCAEQNDFTEWNTYIDEFDGVIRLVGAKFDGLSQVYSPWWCKGEFK